MAVNRNPVVVKDTLCEVRNGRGNSWGRCVFKLRTTLPLSVCQATEDRSQLCHSECYTSRWYATFFVRSVKLKPTHGGRDGTLWRRPIPPIDKRSAKSFIRTNERIRAREIRVIDENGEQLGVMAPFEALKMARERALDLVEISPNAVPPVCKIQDYGKFLYEKDKSDRAARKKQKVIVIKEVKFSVTVDEHDYQTKKNQAVRFLGEGDKVKASLRFKGRQMAHRDLGYKIINRLILDIGDAGLVEFMPRMEGTTLHAILAPSKKTEAPPRKVAAPGTDAAVAAASKHEPAIAEPVAGRAEH
jgi:translation initiation factor IF-3